MGLPSGSRRDPSGHMEPSCRPRAQCSFAQGDGPRQLEQAGLRREEIGADVPAVEGSRVLGGKMVQMGSSSPSRQQGEKPTFNCVEKQVGGYLVHQ